MRKADNATTFLCRCHEIWEPLLLGTLWEPRACNGTDLPFSSYDEVTRVLCEEDGGREQRAWLPGVTDISSRQAGYITETQAKKSVIDCKICFQDAEKRKKKVKKVMMKWAVEWRVNIVWYRPVVSSAVVRSSLTQIVCK